MSKARLKKEISTFSGEQLIELILSAYDSSKEAKSYFEFFLNPDVDTLLEKKKEAISKEARRSKWGTSKARISRIKAEIKVVEGLGVGAEYVGKLRFFAIRELVMLEKYINYTNAFVGSIDKMVGEHLEYMAKNGMLLRAVEDFNNLIINNPDAGTERFRRHLHALVGNFIHDLRTKYGIVV